MTLGSPLPPVQGPPLPPVQGLPSYPDQVGRPKDPFHRWDADSEPPSKLELILSMGS